MGNDHIYPPVLQATDPVYLQQKPFDTTTDKTMEAGPSPFPPTFQPAPQYSCCQHVCQHICQHPKFESVPLYETNPPDSTTNAGDHDEGQPKDAAAAIRKRAKGMGGLVLGAAAGMLIVYLITNAGAHKNHEQEEAQLAEWAGLGSYGA
ncbi:hypothetical protein LTR09_005186 [Extremus antarcticus]|uniref:Uncharacterized protein n=1 Tax=Extremus antarcticus TaxID=702011 RepID=A0AAJ0GCF1_9PEZI|nr:hypothetical protein LTR09_005186 [Extremus antarcticus]